MAHKAQRVLRVQIAWLQGQLALRERKVRKAMSGRQDRRAYRAFKVNKAYKALQGQLVRRVFKAWSDQRAQRV